MSDEAKEAALNAKIEAIRAKNAAREARHREIEADRLEAEKSKSAVSVKTPGEEETEGFKNPYENIDFEHVQKSFKQHMVCHTCFTQMQYQR